MINIAISLYSCFRCLKKLQKYSKQVVGSGLSREEARKTFQMMCLYVYGCLCGNLSLRQCLNVHLQPHPSAKEKDSALLRVFSHHPFVPFLLTHHIDSRPSLLLASTLTFHFVCVCVFFLFCTEMERMWYLWESQCKGKNLAVTSLEQKRIIKMSSREALHRPARCPGTYLC